MTKKPKVRSGLTIISIILLGTGTWLVLPSVGWWGILGLWLLLWGNAINIRIVQGNDMDQLDRQTQYLEIVERFEKRYGLRDTPGAPPPPKPLTPKEFLSRHETHWEGYRQGIPKKPREVS